MELVRSGFLLFLDNSPSRTRALADDRCGSIGLSESVIVYYASPGKGVLTTTGLLDIIVKASVR